jgi:hypothetical protein
MNKRVAGRLGLRRDGRRDSSVQGVSHSSCGVMRKTQYLPRYTQYEN